MEFVRDDGSSLSFATDGTRAFLVWTDSLGETFHCVGREPPDQPLVFDYFGSWSEAPAHTLVALQPALDSVRAFLRDGIPDTELVIYAPE